MMAVFDMNMNNIRFALKAVQALPDEHFLPLMNDDTASAIIKQLFVPIKGRNTHLNADDTKELFGIQSLDDISELEKLPRRQLAASSIVYYKARFDGTPDRNKGALRKVTQCFGMGNDAETYINNVCSAAGISHIPQGGIGGGGGSENEISEISRVLQAETVVSKAVSDPVQPSEAVQTVTALSSLADTRQIKTEQEKDAEQDVGRRAVEAHQTRSIKSVKESAKESHSVESGTDTDIPVSVISPDCFWDYRTACNIVTAEPEPYLIEGMFRKGTITIIGATQNAGKTTVLFDVMGSVATGSNFLVKPDKTGGFKAHQGSCILLDFEGDKVDTASRLRATVDTYSEISGIEPNDIPILVRYMPIDWTGSDKEFPTKVYKAISALPEPYNKPAVLAFDTYSAFSDVENENESTQAQKVFNRFKELKTLFHDETTIFVTMHLRKLNDKKFHDVTMDDLRGTSAAAAAGSDIWFLSEVKGEPTTKKLKQVKAKGRSRSDEIKTLSLAYDSNDDGTYSRVRFFMIEGTDEAEAQAKQTERKQKNEDKRERDILAFIATHPKCSVNRICKVNKDNPEDRLQMNVKTCTPVVDRLIKEGKIYNLSDSENSYCLVINPKYIEEKHN